MREIAPRITVDPEVCSGKPIVKGTQVQVTTVLRCLASGATPEEITKEHGITRADVTACLFYGLVVVEKKWEKR